MDDKGEYVRVAKCLCMHSFTFTYTHDWSQPIFLVPVFSQSKVQKGTFSFYDAFSHEEVAIEFTRVDHTQIIMKFHELEKGPAVLGKSLPPLASYADWGLCTGAEQYMMSPKVYSYLVEIRLH